MAFATIEEAESAIKELRQENAKWRLQVRTLEDDNATVKAEKDKVTGEKDSLAQSIAKMQTDHETATKKLTDDHTAALEESKNSVKEQVKLSKLEALAVKEGLVDPDGLKLLDFSKVELQEDGTLKGAEDVLKAAKEAKPYLFGEKRNSTTTTTTTPKKGDETPVDVRTLSAEEYAKEKATVLGTAK